ncbi:MAG: 50S ribosomal protein L11 methyltransferase [Gaiellaceae bacterium]
MAVEHAEEARAQLIELAPKGFEERELVAGLELAVYGGAAEEKALRAVFGRVRSEPVEPGWQERWRSFHRPVTVGRLWVGPSWEAAPDDVEPVVIDPGRAFGTGSHPTTRLCLELLQNLEAGSLLDVGCGSGVLSIAAARLGFGPIRAIDSDADAIEASAANAARNGVTLDLWLGDALLEELPPADVAVANISAAVVERVAARLRCARLVLSGFLASERLSLPGFALESSRELEGWSAYLLSRRQ